MYSLQHSKHNINPLPPPHFQDAEPALLAGTARCSQARSTRSSGVTIPCSTPTPHARSRGVCSATRAARRCFGFWHWNTIEPQGSAKRGELPAGCGEREVFLDLSQCRLGKQPQRHVFLPGQGPRKVGLRGSHYPGFDNSVHTPMYASSCHGRRIAQLWMWCCRPA